MNRILPLLLLLLLVSCAQPPPRNFAPYGAEPRPRAASTVTVETSAAQSVKPAALSQPAAAAQVSATNPPSATPAVPAATPAAAAQPSLPGHGPHMSAMTNGLARAAAAETNENASGARANEELIPAGTINFPATDLNQVLQIYSELVNRTVLRPANLPAPLITLKTQTPLTKKEAIEAFDAVLGMNGITMINIGDKFVKAVPTTQAGQEGARSANSLRTNCPRSDSTLPTWFS